MKYAIIQTGGKQYRVQEGDQILVEKVLGIEGDPVRIEDVVMVKEDNKLICQKEDLSKAKVKATIVKHIAGEKVTVFKYRPKKGYRKKRGHRQHLTLLKIEEIVLPKTKVEAAGQEKVRAKAEEEKLKEKPKEKTRTVRTKQAEG